MKLEWRGIVPVHLFAAAALVTGGFFSTVAAQSPGAPSDFEQDLLRLQQQIDELKMASPVAQVGACLPADPAVACCAPAPEKPKFPTARLTGFFQADAVWFSQDATNIAAVGDVQDGADFRRARLAATGQAWDNVSYMLEMDFAFPGRPSFMDVWMEIDDVVGNNKLRIGQFRQPFGMEGLTSVKDLPFLERGLPFAFLPFRQIGAMLHGNQKDELATWSFAGFRFPTDVYGGNVGDNGGYGMATRLTALLLSGGQGSPLLHAGFGYSYIDPANDQFQYRNQPEVFVGETGGGVPAGVPGSVPPFVDTGILTAANANLLSAELASAVGSFYAQSEFIFANVDQIGGPSVTLPGASILAGYFLTGESRPYNGKNGVFGGVKPHCNVGKQGGIGAWEIVGRWSYLDLNDQNVQGGRLNDITAGLNWYLNPHTKFQFNYIYAMLDKPTAPGAGSSEAGIFAMRAQVDF
ncbi:MAG: porin [Planctomycetales bacterium]|nr:porin [Planctomycetales bacterium]